MLNNIGKAYLRLFSLKALYKRWYTHSLNFQGDVWFKKMMDEGLEASLYST